LVARSAIREISAGRRPALRFSERTRAAAHQFLRTLKSFVHHLLSTTVKNAQRFCARAEKPLAHDTPCNSSWFVFANFD
jgi:hypothetical protein